MNLPPEPNVPFTVEEEENLKHNMSQIQAILDQGKIVKASRPHALGTHSVIKYLDRIEWEEGWDADLLCMGGSSLCAINPGYTFEAVDNDDDDTSDLRIVDGKLNIKFHIRETP